MEFFLVRRRTSKILKMFSKCTGCPEHGEGCGMKPSPAFRVLCHRIPSGMVLGSTESLGLRRQEGD
jgi:hypothetical protein